MDASAPANLIETLSALSEVPFRYDSRDAALKRITELGKRAMRSHTCSLAFIDLEHKTLTHVACKSDHQEMERFLIGRPLHIGSRLAGHHLDWELTKGWEGIEKYHLQRDGQGVADPEVARKYGFNSLLSHPLKSDGELIGYINHFSRQAKRFKWEPRRLLETFAHQATLTIEWFERFHVAVYSAFCLCLRSLRKG
jgi:hypothetical protein